MKKTLLFIFTICAAQFSTAQVKAAAGVTITNYTTITDKNEKITDQQKASAGFFMKVSKPILFNDVFFIEPGIGFNTTKTLDNKGPGISNSNFIVPVELGVNIANKFQFNAGIQGNFTINANASQFNSNQNIKEYYKSSYADFIGGITITPTDRVGLLFRYNYSLSSVFEKDYLPTGYDIRKSVFTLALQFKI